MIYIMVLHVSHVIVAIHLVSYSFFDDLAAFVVNHALMSCFLKPRLRVLVHLVPLSDLLPIVADSLLLLCLVTLRDRVPISVHLG